MIGNFPLDVTELAKVEAQPLVSVIIDNYNYGRFLKQAIDSVLEQTYKNVELIVVDDGSTDQSREIIRAYDDRLIAMFQDNAGAGEAFNAGIRRSQGSIICLLDSDDYFHPQKIEKVVAAFQTYPEWVQVSHQCISVDTYGVPFHRGGDNTVFDQGDVRELLLAHGKYKWMRTSGRAYRREALLQVLPITSGRGSADGYLQVTVPFYGLVGSIEEPLMFYRVHGKNKRAGTADLDYLIQGREQIASYVNAMAEKLGFSHRFQLQRDADYRTFAAMRAGGASWLETLWISWLVVQECVTLRRTPRQTLTRVMWGGICLLFPQEGRKVLHFGLRRYLRSKLLNRPLDYDSIRKPQESQSGVMSS